MSADKASTPYSPEESVRRGLRNLLFHGIFSTAWDTLTTGPFLVGFALAFGANNLTLGLLVAIPSVTQLLQIGGVYLVERWRRRKMIVALFGLGTRTVWALIALIPLFTEGQAALSILLVGIFLGSSLGAFVGVAFNSWIRDFVPQPIMGRYFGNRSRLSMIAAMILGLLGGFFVSYWKTNFPDSAMVAYAFVFGAAALCAYLSLWFLVRVPEPDYGVRGEGSRFIDVLMKPIRDPAFRGLLWFLLSWGFTINLALPFFSVYMLKRLGFDISTVVVYATASQLSYLLFVRLWGRLSDRFGNKPVLYICGVLMLFTILAFPFTNLPERHVLTIPMIVGIHIIAGIATGGVNLTSSNIALKAAPHGAATAYMAANGLVGAAAGATAPLLSGALTDFFSSRTLSIRLTWDGLGHQLGMNVLHFQGLDFAFFLAFVLGFLVLHRLPFVKEEGVVTEDIDVEHLAQELASEIKGITSVAGLRKLRTLSIPFGLLSKRGRSRQKVQSQEGKPPES